MGSSSVFDSDVLVVGGGPAGCSAGILTARQGCRVNILEKNPQGHHKVCGDLLGPRALYLLQALQIGWPGSECHGLPIQGIHVYDDKRLKSAARFQAAGEEHAWGMTLRRDHLDGFLLERAEEAGCTVFHGVRFKGIVERDVRGIVCVAETRQGDRFFRARMLLGADGVHSATARAAGLYQRNAKSRILAVRGYFRNVAGLRDAVELYFLPHLLPGYAWVIPLGEDLANIGLGLRADACMQGGVHLARELERFVKEHPHLSRRLQEAQSVGRPQASAIGTYGQRIRRVAPHVLLMGDAGGFADPLSGEGIFGAIQSARMAAGVVKEAFAQDNFTEGFLAGYEERCKKPFDGAYRYAAFLAGLPVRHGPWKPVVRWGLNQVEKNCLVDSQYARMVAGFFTGMVARKRIWSTRWFRRTLLG